MKKYKGLNLLVSFLGLLMGIIGVMLYRELPPFWNSLMFFPIAIGYYLWFKEWR